MNCRQKIKTDVFKDCVGYKYTQSGKPGTKFTGTITTKHDSSIIVKNSEKELAAERKDDTNYCTLEFSYNGSTLTIPFDQFAAMNKVGGVYGMESIHTILIDGYKELIKYSINDSLYINGYVYRKQQMNLEFGSGPTKDSDICQGFTGTEECFHSNMNSGFRGTKVGAVWGSIAAGLTSEQVKETVDAFTYIIQNTTVKYD